jgi:hypothetical protein
MVRACPKKPFALADGTSPSSFGVYILRSTHGSTATDFTDETLLFVLPSVAEAVHVAVADDFRRTAVPTPFYVTVADFRDSLDGSGVLTYSCFCNFSCHTAIPLWLFMLLVVLF